MILQSIILPQNQKEDTASLYYQHQGAIQLLNKQSVLISAGARISFCSFFNALSDQRWSTFTELSSCQLRVWASGSGILRLMYHQTTGSKLVNSIVISSQSEQEYCFSIPLTKGQGLYALEMQAALDSALTLYKAYFYTEEKPCNKVQLAIVSCTFKREAYITKNVAAICANILSKEKLDLGEHLHLFIIDNGRTLKESQFPDSYVTLIPNSNTGGSGGFTRGIIEVLTRPEIYTHVLLMDDDIEFETESLERTYAFLCYVKKEYRQAVLGGAMLRNDAPCILEEAGANWNGRLDSKGRGWNLGKEEFLYRYDQIGNVEYQAWWFCCIPTSIIGLNNLPLPFFIHDDDIEYGLRNYKQVIQLNGICVWHNTFENKRPSNLEYYDVRNHLILNAMHPGRTTLLKQIKGLFKRSTALILRMRYDDVLLNVRGIQDFLKGPEWWAKQPLDQLHFEILKAGYIYETLPDDSLPIQVELSPKVLSRQQKFWRAITFNGAFIPKKKEAVCIPCGSNPFCLYRARQGYLLDPVTGKAIHVTFSFSKIIKAYSKLLLVLIKLSIHYHSIAKQYRTMLSYLGSQKYWQRYI